MSETIPAAPHIPVLLDEVIAALAPAPGETIVDGTFGAGGYTRALLSRGACVIAFDRDPDAIAAGQDWADGEERLTLVAADFSAMVAELEARDALPVDGITLDIGVSSMQLDQAERGFSFQSDGPLDMRMAQAGMTAADFVNEADEDEIADVLYHFGDEPKSRRVARAIVAARPMTRTGELAHVVRRALGYKAHDKKDPATRAFQAIRIHINRELGELADGLLAAERALKPGGRLAIVTFHSLEDRMVKRFLRTRSGSAPSGSRHLPQAKTVVEPSFTDVGRPVRAGEDELARNPRARSATLRTARRTSAQPWTEEVTT
ncbi:S-adenosyl-dependent methyltransferase activity on membrane-located substrates [Sphingomonas sp. T1]|uniref:16S rRNA (cytosine(1402)-N(4))-methyltransferase RsmH n=1 Tax=unclassified Sphingomonas TaxID=196159 RepID=UPI0004DFA502|nr:MULTISPECIES: 16S rRNA (cytosine(1402)-N(4))-methyltransferase RsmH [unclassified Sphingomonas]KHA65237.1 16S rRNA methyltransferase [Sphingomonas sp. Ant20]KQN14501.1 ribosomal RNA small subunit methyltransferase H [Sphingomonas sp. Leaf30]MDY1008514.1 16S rRNA (cytosine(1402)-N(4))-methyltransferase RsmH [Sphingomonas sp. CFBP9019]VXC60563.1 S-adenosyl-dependent methyltransferase activity on membrane-located substrates [Sphingomonas sp. T1]